MQNIKQFSKMTPTQIIVVSFFLIVLFGGILLTLPCFNKVPLDLVNGFFLAASGVSGAGLTPIVPAEQFNFWGQLLLLIIIQIRWIRIYDFCNDIFYSIKKENHFKRANDNWYIIW